MKLEAKDLRIGNLIECDNVIIEVDSISKYYVNGFDKANNIDTRVPVKHCKGIPLTEEWLLKLPEYLVSKDIPSWIKFVHHLQNWYWAENYCKKELTIKNQGNDTK